MEQWFSQTSRQFINELNPFGLIFEMIRIFPDAFFWGIGILSLVTLSFSYGVFFVSLIEAICLYYLIKNVNNALGIVDTNPGSGSSERSCKPGFSDYTLESISLFGEPSEIPFPSSHTYLLAFITTYILSVISTFKNELDILGPVYGENYTTRMYFSQISFAVLMFMGMSYRLFFQCDSAITIMFSFILGALAGLIVVMQNNLILGVESLNLLGVPILNSRTAEGNDLVVCSSSF